MGKPERTYSISELAREFKVTPRALRFYEDKGLLTPRRDGLNRVYGSRDRARLQLILRGKRVGFPLSEIKEILDLYDLGDNERTQMQTALGKFKARLSVLEAQREDLEGAIRTLVERIQWLEAHLAQPASQASTAAARAFEKVARKRLGEAS
jgi:DNA-binding transcriptional MerR regulator